LRAVNGFTERINTTRPGRRGQRPAPEKIGRNPTEENTMTGTNLSQDDYLKLEKAAAVEILTDAEAILRINNEFGFEAARIDILHEAEIDATESGARYVKIEKAERKPLWASSDYNYVRFNVRTRPATWYYEMINGHLHFVNI
jgi:hypothetical protein